ncbi:pre-rRNA-processing protein esf1 [Andrographis paniculata]|uniref:pre-rRNA-processing protein esf1 n=1 Tax=Andrographis paniculata TaxID=175694 RepID=UPI0021E8D49C|nr:pre-rRNA-processing protein esf1 [Andrographis paniculata]
MGMDSSSEKKKKKKKQNHTMDQNNSTRNKKKKKNNNIGKGKEEDQPKCPTITDDRFASAHSDPRFMEAPKKRSKVSIDSRFRRVFTDRRFTTSNAPTDKRGKSNKKNKDTGSLKHYYRLGQQEDEGENEKSRIEEEEDIGDGNAVRGEADGVLSETDSDKSNESLEEDDSDNERSLDESTSTSSSDSDVQYYDEEEEDTFLQPEDVPEIDKETRRLAVVNLDWSQVRAVDLYVLLNSFVPKGGQIVSVTVYPSEFGLKRMEEEAVHGPVGLFDEEESDGGEDDEIDKKKLRDYELSKLKYYYAVVECDSITTSDYLYNNCDGLEFERSANKLDLRFIPDSMEFKQPPRDVATEAPADYQGLDFQTRALQHSSVQLTWDEDEPQRAKALRRKFTDEQLADMELKEILASDESETDEEKKVDKYRALIGSGDASDEENEEDNNQDMEVTFNSGLEDISKRILEKDKKSETVWEAYLRKRREKKKASKHRSKYSSEDDDSDSDQEEIAEEADDFFVAEPPANQAKRSTSSKKAIQDEAEASRAELELLAADDQGADPNLRGYNLKRKKGKGKKENGIQEVSKIPDADFADPRFSALFTSPLFALDPTDPQFKRSATHARQLAQKQKEKPEDVVGPMNDSETPGNQESDQVPGRMKGKVRSAKLKSKRKRLKH